MAWLRPIEVKKDGVNVVRDILRFCFVRGAVGAVGAGCGRAVGTVADNQWEGIAFLLMCAVGISLIKDGIMGKTGDGVLDWLAFGMIAEWWQRGWGAAVVAASAAVCIARLVGAYLGKKQCPNNKITAGIATVLTSVELLLLTHGYTI